MLIGDIIMDVLIWYKTIYIHYIESTFKQIVPFFYVFFLYFYVEVTVASFFRFLILSFQLELCRHFDVECWHTAIGLK